MRVLGLDPGLTCAGYGVVERKDGGIEAITHGGIRTPPGPVPGRLAALYDEICGLIDVHAPDAVAVERVLFNSNVRTAISVAQAAGVALLAAQQRGCEIAEYTPTEVKMSITGFGGADKKQMQTVIKRLLGLPAAPKPADAADALGLALAHVHAYKMKRVASGA